MKRTLIGLLAFGLLAVLSLSACQKATTTTLTTSATTGSSSSGSTTSSVISETTTTPTLTSHPSVTVPGVYEGDGDFSIAVDLDGLTFLGLMGNGIGPGDYSLQGSVLVLFESFLSGLEDAEYLFHLFAGEADVPFVVKVERKFVPILGFDSENGVFTKGRSENLTASLGLSGETLLYVSVDGNVLGTSSYECADGTLVIEDSVFAASAYGINHVLSVTSTGGTAEISFVVNDVPAIADKTDFIKYPGETITGENFGRLVTNEIGLLSYGITLAYGEGTLTDHGDGTFDFVPATILSGTAGITITATDSYGVSAERTIVLVFKEVDPSAIPLQEFRASEPSDLVIPVAMRGNESADFPVEFVSVLGNGIGEDDYVTDDSASTLTLRQAFLSSLVYGDYVFTVTTTAGSVDFHVHVMENPVWTLLSADNVETAGSASDLLWSFDTKGAAFAGLFLGDSPVSGESYSWADGILTLPGAFLDSFPAGWQTFTFATEAGSASLSVLLNDVPVLAAKTDFIKFPGETVRGEDLRPLVADLYGSLSYSIVLKSGDGTFSDHGDGTFDFTPAVTAPGSATFTFTATDGYGASASEDIVLTFKTVNPFIYDADSKVVDKKDSFGDIVMTVDTFGTESSSLYFEMTGIFLNGSPLAAEDYVLCPGGDHRLFALKAAYLRSLPVGIHVFTLLTEAGSAEFAVEVRDTRPVAVDVSSVSHIKTVTETDPVITLTLYANLVAAADITMNAAGFVAGEAFDYAGGVLTLHASFLDSLASGTYAVGILGTDRITVVIHDPTAPRVADADKSETVEKAALSGPLTVSVSLFGLEAETAVRFGGSLLGAPDILVSEDAVTLSRDFLSGLDYGAWVFTVENSNGSDTFTLRISDAPSDGGVSQNVTKFTYETLSAEALRVEAAGSWSLSGYSLVSLVYYSYASDVSGDSLEGIIASGALSGTGAFGTLSIDPETGTFALVRNPGWYGIVVFGYLAEDETGLASAVIAMDVHFLPVAPAIADAAGKTFDTSLAPDVVFTVTNALGNADFPVWGIRRGSEWLVEGTDYLVGPHEGSNRYFTLTSAYLSTLENGLQEFVLYTEGGSAGFSITVTTPLSVSDPEADYDKGDPADVSFAVSGYPLEIASVKWGDVELGETDWAFAGGILTIRSTWLFARSYGTVVLALANAQGSFSLSIHVVDSNVPALLTTGQFYVKNSSSPVEVDVSLYDAAFVSVSYRGTILTTSQYRFANGTLTLYGTYLETLAVDYSDLSFSLTTSENVIDFVIGVHADENLPDLTLASGGFRIDEGNDVEYSVVTHDAVLSGLSYLGDPLTEGTDYSFESSTSVLTLRGSWLLGLYDFENGAYSLTWESEDGRDVNFDVVFDHPENRIVNGGFESGNLYGWNAFGIWKNESGMFAWTDDRVVSGTYFDGNYAYNRDGSYNLGIYGGSISKDSGQERMGYLRSSDFVLGGSGWISFKLGGGKNSSFAYVSVRRTEDDVEVARFGNPRFNTAVSGIDNTEAYLFTYYFDLSSVAAVGESYYFLITDAASNEWCVLSADSFRTYWEEAPVPGTGEAAANILPLIQGTGTAENAIVNGTFETSLDGWTDVSGIFRIYGGRLRSDLSGDAGTGVLRSSAFTVTENKYLRLDWNGGLKYDKQIFISVKEVGTNIEVLRFVRREDMSTYAGDGWDNALLDLSSLDPAKQYYLEIADNTAASWGLALVHNLRFISETEYLSVTSGDRAVSVTGLATDFPYTRPGD